MAFRTIVNNGVSSNRVDMVFLAEGYTASQLGTFTANVNTMLDYLFKAGQLSDPFGRYTKFFNVHLVDTVSAQSGADNPATGTFVDTALNAKYFWDGTSERLLYIDDNLADQALATNLAGAGFNAELKFVAVNSEKYGGGGGKYGVYSAGNNAARDIALHEVGHSFAKLADEYTYGGPTTYAGGESPAANLTTNAAGAKWANWIGYNQPGIGTIGVYEGGGYSEKGIFRPSDNSKMRALDNPFDAISREAFILKFYELVRPLDTYSYNGQQGTIANVNALWVLPVDAAIMDVKWFVDGVEVKSVFDATNVTMAQLGLTGGTHTITAQTYDPTDWVRVADRSALQQNVTWTVSVSGQNGGVLNSMSFEKQLEVIYNGYFNRAGESGGFNFWLSQYRTALTNGQTAEQALSAIANGFRPQAETLKLYPALAVANPDLKSADFQTQLSTFLDDVYRNLFSRTAEAGGKAFWMEQITSGKIDFGAAIYAIANGAAGSDITIIQNRAEAGLYFTTKTAAAGTTINTKFLTEAAVALSSVNASDASVAASKARVDAYVVNPGAVPAESEHLYALGDDSSDSSTDISIVGLTSFSHSDSLIYI